MLNLFKRKKILAWEISLLENVIDLLPQKYKHLNLQIEKGLFRGVLIGLSDIEGYVGFSLNSDIQTEFFQPTGRNFMLTGIEVKDLLSGTFLNYSVYISFGMINGYSINSNAKFEIDVNDINVQKLDIRYLDEKDFLIIRHLFSVDELNLINPAEVHEIIINNIKYYSIRDLGDGNFIGIDLNKKFYRIMHENPMRIELINGDLKKILQ